ncbi:MAG: T9SS type A sorting domain-containing protein [Bacteroidales bacterium]|nr:T9SS type A sorting domain-containing protein [Bacteroidales bacterium]
MKKYFLCMLTLVAILPLAGQGIIGKWRTHLAYNSVNQIAQSKTKIFAVSEGSLYSVSKLDGDIEFYSKMSGLNDANIIKIEYDEANNQLLIIYQNGNIDIMHEAGVNNIPDLFRKQMSSSKAINEVSFAGKNAYLSSDFGILLVNMEKQEITDTYIIGQGGRETKVLSTALHNDTLYAISENQLLWSDAKKPHLLVNFEYWKPVAQLPGSGNFKRIFSFGGKLILLRGSELYRRDEGNSWTQLASSLNIHSAHVSHGRIILNDKSSYIFTLDEQFELRSQQVTVSDDVEYDNENSTFWLAGMDLGVISAKIKPGQSSEINYYKPKGPALNIPYWMTFSGEKLFVVPGGRWDNTYNRPGIVMIYENGQWKNIYSQEIVDIIQQQVPGQPVLDFVNVAVNPLDSRHFYVTSFGNGLFEFRNDQFVKWHTHKNSPFVNVFDFTPYSYIRLDGATFDADGNLWLCNMFDANAIKILTAGGQWKSLYFAESNKPTLGNILINNQNPKQKWVNSVRSPSGIFIFDDNGTFDDQSDDKNRFISAFPDTDNPGSDLRPAYIYTLQQDKNGVIWAGTDIGPLLFYNTNRAFESTYTCSRVKIPRNDGTNQADYLLKDETIQAIAIDGANRKWLGTKNSGLYLMSDNGQETIRHFTSSNSPLLSDNILSITINPVSGEVFIGTSNGLVSYQSDAAESTGAYNNVYAYPNPVRENYQGIITITGLIDNTQVKITDISGNLIYQTVSNGSMATWDGNDVHGRRVSTGVYLAICASEDGTQSTITKIMVIN